jgi:predicted nuclease of restriction endonuclease-like (RecB) superfamily
MNHHTDINNSEYQNFLTEVLQHISNSQIKVAKAINVGINELYWDIGKLIIEKQKHFGWGKSVVELLSLDLIRTVGGSQSWSSRNLWFMRQLFEEYSQFIQSSHIDDVTILKQLASELPNLKQLVSQIPWYHNILILQKVKDINARIYYLKATATNGWSRAVLLNQIKARAFEYYLNHPKQHNFEVALPEYLHEQANESLKSVYNLDFLGINKPIKERKLETMLTENVKRFIMELGYGFCFIGNQYKLTLGTKEYFTDLLFYHRILKCLVAIELKVVDFEPEFLGKLNYYLELMDEQLKQPDDNLSIGILLCPGKDNLEVEYALRIATKPIGVAEYRLTKELPSKYKGKLPTIDEIKKGLKLKP